MPVDLNQLPCPSRPLADDPGDPRRSVGSSAELKESILRLIDATKQADGSFAELPNTILLRPETVAFVRDYCDGAHTRAGRRRSRQCRGSRARNFVDAVKSGAYAAASRKAAK